MTQTYRQKFGRWGEDIAAAYLQERGYRLLERNLRTRYGEIDLVALQQESNTLTSPEALDLQDSVVVFIEVKTRSSTSFGLPEEAVTPKKKKHLLQAAEAYMQDHPELPRDWRIDVIAILGKKIDSPWETIHFENVVN